MSAAFSKIQSSVRRARQLVRIKKKKFYVAAIGAFDSGVSTSTRIFRLRLTAAVRNTGNLLIRYIIVFDIRDFNTTRANVTIMEYTSAIYTNEYEFTYTHN